MRLLWLVLGICALSNTAEAGTRHALFVASNAAPAGFDRLLYAHNDAEKMYDVMVELGGIAPENATMLFDPGADDVRNALYELRSLAETQEDRELIFYYSGHADQSALLLGRERFPFAEIRNFLEDDRAGLRLAIIDSCSSGALSKVKGGKMRPGIDISWSSERPVKGAVLITSSTAEEASVERDDVGGSLFSHFFVSGLRGAADNDDNGVVTLEEVFRYAYNHTLERSTETRAGVQHPTYEYRIAGQRQLVLSRLAQQSFMSFGKNLVGTYVVFDRRRNQVVAEITKVSDEQRRLWLPPSDYYVKKRLPSAVLLQKVVLEEGQGHEVKDHEMYTVPYEEDVTKGNLSKAFRPTWKYGAPYIPGTAHTLRRGELSLGLWTAGVGVTDSVMLSTSPLLDTFLSPTIETKLRLIHGDALVWSMKTAIAVSFFDRIVNDAKRSTIGLDVGSALSWLATSWMTISFLVDWEMASRPNSQVESEEDGSMSVQDWESQNVRGGLSFIFLLGERNLIQLQGEAIYTYYYPSGVSMDTAVDWRASLLYGHAWRVFRLSVGVIRDTSITDILGIEAYPLPFVDFWWRW